MKYFLARDAVLKWLETPSIYHIEKDDLYELDNDSFEFLKIVHPRKFRVRSAEL